MGEIDLHRYEPSQAVRTVLVMAVRVGQVSRHRSRKPVSYGPQVARQTWHGRGAIGPNGQCLAPKPVYLREKLYDGLTKFERVKARAFVYHRIDPTDRIVRFSLDEAPTQERRSL